jgi:hypothetical protein
LGARGVDERLQVDPSTTDAVRVEEECRWESS